MGSSYTAELLMTGFRPIFSIPLIKINLIKVHCNISDSIEEGSKARLVFLEICEAFNIIYVTL